MSYLQNGELGHPGGCGSCGPDCGCRSCRGLSGLAERYEREEEDDAPPARPAPPPRAPAPATVSGWGLAYAAAPHRRAVPRRRGPSVRQLQDEIFRLRRQLRDASRGRSVEVARGGPLPSTDELPQRAPTESEPESPPPPESGSQEAPPDAGTGWFGDSQPPPPDIVKVRGIRVASALAPRLAALLAAAEADGVRISGWGYRSRDRQIELRREHCGPTHYDIWEKPSSQCRPPTATPGHSMHERGLAIDFTQHGRALTRESSGFHWLLRNGARFGLKNLPSEPWHWSVNGR